MLTFAQPLQHALRPQAPTALLVLPKTTSSKDQRPIGSEEIMHSVPNKQRTSKEAKRHVLHHFF